MDNIYYYPISSTSLASIFSQACILPACLYPNRPRDLQSEYEEVILLTDNFGCKEADCCLQVILTNKEKESLISVSNGFFYYEEALPISRVKKIYFTKVEQISRTISNIILSTAFIPNHIIEYGSIKFADISCRNVMPPLDLVSSISKVRKSYDQYNRILGALALMKVAHEDGCNASPHYIDTVSKFNKLIESQKGTSIDIKFHKVFDNPTTFPFLKETIDSTTLEDEARKNNQTIKKNSITKVVDPSNLEKSTYLCYVLNNYGVADESRRNKIDELILNNFSELKPGYGESCALYYGFNRGYAAFNNQYKKDSKTEIVKFKLESLLDYYIIESVFEYSFDHTTPAEITLFNGWIPSTTSKVKKGEYVILDTVICDKKKVALFSCEWWENYLHSLQAKTSLIFLGTDFSESIKELILEPFANIIKDEISEEYEDNLALKIERANCDINRLQSEIDKYVQENQELRNELTQIASPKKSADLIVVGSMNQGCNVGSQMNCEEKEDYAKRIIKLCSLNLKDLTKEAKSKGLSVSKGELKENIILKILAADNSNYDLKFS
jgi:hypothetical protein